MTTFDADDADDATVTDDAPDTEASPPTLIEEGRRYGLSGSYSPEDNKLRLRIGKRMPRELYDRFQFRERGFLWAPKQQLLVAPMWTPARHDFLLSLCQEIGDEETSLAERAEQRAERFVGYQVNRIVDGNRAYDRASELSDGIPFGQPILVGHHSQDRAERDARRIDGALRTAVIMWERAEYWEWRAPRVIAHADYKDRADVRARRIETIEAEKRRQERTKAKAEKELKAWTLPNMTPELARAIANRVWLTVYRDGHRLLTAYDVLRGEERRAEIMQRCEQHGTALTEEKLAEIAALCPVWTVEQVQDVARRVYPSTIAYAQRWINHCELRITYERAILAAQGGSHLLEKKPRPKQPPLLNYRAPEGLKVMSRYRRGEVEHRPQVEMTAAEFQKIYDDYRGTQIVGNGSECHRVRSAIIGNGRLDTRQYVVVFLTDSKEHKRPEKLAAEANV
jgi:hypothetical protein